MNLWVRLIRVALGLVGKPRIDLLGVTRIRLRVWPNDLDLNGHVNNGRYLSLADLGRIDWFVRTGILSLARRNKAFPIVGDAIAKFRRDLKVFQAFEIESRMLGWDEKWGFMEHRFIKDGRVIGVVAIRGVFKTSEGSLRPGNLLAGLGVAIPSPPLPNWVAHWHQGCEAMSTLLRSEEQLTRPRRRCFPLT
ncbi:MAG: thioesterase family protein [Candidatus Obscuribacterales bacterium]|nr:thioesterase family protein [Steroidobacteraceae bacterium]